MIPKLTQLSPLQVTLLVVGWPVLLAIVALVGLLWLTREGVYLIGVNVSSLLLLLLIAFGPSVALGALWVVGRRRRGHAT